MKRQRGFTFVELLVALSITVILVLLLTSVVAAVLGAWSQGRNRLDTYSNARQIILRITDELKGAVATPSVSGSRIQFVENVLVFPMSSPVPVPSPTPGVAENVFLVSPYPNSGAGDLCVIAYALDWRTHELKRAFRSSDTAWNATPGPRYQASGYSFVSSEWRVVATGVLEFELKCYSQANLDPSPAPIPTVAASWDSTTPTPSWMTGLTPRRVIVRLKMVDDRTLATLSGLTSGTSTYDSIVLRTARDFTAEVSLPSL